jgi:uncharacterized protein with HEPN domain
MFLKDVLQNAKRTENFTKNMTFADFSSDEKTTYATLHAIMIIGEAVKQIPEEVREKYPDVPWRQIGRMRDKLVHHYFAVDIEVVWKTVAEDIIPLREAVESILENDDQS